VRKIHLVKFTKPCQPDQFAIAFCSIEGQQFSIGQSDMPFSMQASATPVNYMMAIAQNGVNKVHKHVGMEPSGAGFNQMRLKEL